jgi:hypothetical protein
MRIPSELSSLQEPTTEDASAIHADYFDISAFSLVRNFVEQVIATGGPASSVDVYARTAVIDWDVLGNSVARSASFEQAIGRAVLIADQMSRGVFQDESPEVSPSSLQDAEPFFAFSVGNAIPDFGDESRYRTRVARKMGGVLKRKKNMGITGISVVLALFLFGFHQVA